MSWLMSMLPRVDQMNLLAGTFRLLGLTLTMLCSSMAQTSNYYPMLTIPEQKMIADGEVVLRELDSVLPGGQLIETVGVIRSTEKVLIDLLTDYSSYPEFMTAVAAVEVVESIGDSSILNYHLQPILGYTKQYRLSIAPSRLGEKVWKLEWFLVSWPGLSASQTIQDTRGYWLIIAEAPQQMLVQYSVDSDPGPIPFGLGGLVEIVAKRKVKKVFEETRQRAEQLTEGKP